jgi:hypothetical protein
MENRRTQRCTLSARPASVRDARAWMQAWLQVIRWPGDLAEDIVFAVSEAVSNVVERLPNADLLEITETIETVEIAAVVESAVPLPRVRPPSPDPDQLPRILAVPTSRAASGTWRCDDASLDGRGDRPHRRR